MPVPSAFKSNFPVPETISFVRYIIVCMLKKFQSFYVLIHIATFVLFGIFGSFIFLGLTFLSQHQERIPQKEEQFIQKFMSQNHNTNETFLGTIRTTKEMENVNIQEESSQILISSFGEEEYECTGSCYCDYVNFERRFGASVLRSGIPYLVAAASSIVALNLAKNHFQSDCVGKYSETFACESESVVSEVHECHSVFEESKSQSDDDRIETWEEAEKGIYEDWRKYFCYGNCVMLGGKYLKGEARKQGKEFNCEKLKQEGELTVFESDVHCMYNNIDLTSLNGAELSTRFRETARNLFIQRHLTDFCRENSKITYDYTAPKLSKDRKGVRKYKQKRRVKVRVCASKNVSSTRNVKCRQIEPAPTARNCAWRNRVWHEAYEEWSES